MEILATQTRLPRIVVRHEQYAESVLYASASFGSPAYKTFYHRLYGTSFNFRLHPTTPVGTNVLTWNAPDHRGSWADHGVPAVYLGPNPNYFRAFEVWVPNTSAPRITNTVWWFMHEVRPDVDLLGADQTHAYPPTKDRPDPQPSGTDLIGRVFLEPDKGVCQITA